jgi:hypothetical protein
MFEGRLPIVELQIAQVDGKEATGKVHRTSYGRRHLLLCACLVSLEQNRNTARGRAAHAV